MLFSFFMIWNESRQGITWHDPVLASFRPINLSLPIGILTNGGILIALIRMFARPATAVYFFYAALCIIIFRTLTLYFVPLNPPITIIPLSDPLLETTFYGGNVLLKDLFFSGHTANLLLVGLLSNERILKISLHCIAALVGLFLIMQHVHYSADVVAAPFFAVLAYKCAVLLGNRTLLSHLPDDQKRKGKIFMNS
ncbi:MAG: sphingomyelin synthase family protein [Saprospiraceae bacterium]|nr:sphingomyelin synthase family protein [Saprospiraceae bacterium]